MAKNPERLAGSDHIRGGEFALFAAILSAAMAVRLWNISWGLPDVFEEATPFTVARRFWGGPGGPFTFIPEFYHYPSLSFYIHFLVQAAYYAVGALTGQWPTLDAFRLALAADPGSFMTGARLASALLDAGTVGLAWFTAREHFGSGTAIGAALLAAFNPLQVEQAQGVNVDVALAFFLMLALRKSLTLTGHSGARDFVVAGALIGLAASTKYTGALFLAVPAFAVGADFIAGTARTARFALREAALALLVPVAAAAVFATLNPGIIADPDGFLRDFSYEQQHMAYGHLGLDPDASSAAFYLVGAIGGRLGFLFLAGALAGVIVAAARKNPGGIAIAAMAIIYIAVISTWEMHAERYLLPAVPLLAILCSAGCVGSMRWAAERSTDSGRLRPLRPFLVRALPAAAVLAALAVPAMSTVRHIDDFGRTDTRTRAREWIAANVQPGSIIVSGPFGIGVPESTASVVYIPFAPTNAEALAPFYDARWYEDFELLIASDYDLARYRREPERFGRMLRFEDDLRTRWRLIAEFSPDAGGDDTARLRGPAIRFHAPDRSARTDTFAADLLRDLASVDGADLVAQFAGNLSRALYARGRFAKCEQLIDIGLRAAPDDARLVQTKAFLLYKRGSHRDALETIARAERLGGGGLEVLLLKGNILMEAGELAPAEEAFVRARDLHPSAALPHTLLIGLYSTKGDTGALAGALDRYLAILPPGGPEARRVGVWLDSLKTAR